MAGREPRVLNKRDPVALALSLGNLLVLLGGGAWYGGSMEQRVGSLEDARREERAAAINKVNLDAMQTVQLAELQKDVKYMREILDRMDKRTPDRGR